jgi:class 3 adenylate cyclase
MEGRLMLNKLQLFRSRRGLTEAELAKQLDVSKQTIVAIEKGKYDPSLPLATEIARFFRVAIEDIFPAALEDVVSTNATFVMTDIEGSTELAVALGEAYIDVLRRQREILVGVVTSHGGRIVDDTGDANFAVFESASAAITASLAAQRAITSEEWPGDAEIRIRIGVHTGEAYAVGNRFVGLAVHEAARVCEEAKGGQILISESTAASGAEPAKLSDGGSHDLQGVGKRRLFVVGE